MAEFGNRMLNQRENANKIIKKFSDRLTGAFLDVIILSSFLDRTFSGYDVVKLIQEKHHFLISTGKVYSTLYAMERKNLVVGRDVGARKRLYKVTDLGKLTLDLSTSRVEMDRFMSRIIAADNAVDNSPALSLV